MCCFYNSGLEEFVAPQGLKKICGAAFCGCKSLKRVVLNEGLKTLSDDDFSGVFEKSGIEEIRLPSTLKKIDRCTFSKCNSFRTIYVRNGCRANLSRLDLPSSVKIVQE